MSVLACPAHCGAWVPVDAVQEHLRRKHHWHPRKIDRVLSRVAFPSRFVRCMERRTTDVSDEPT